MSCFFFFQAEDGIRDYKVTGVQTCALPISSPACTARMAAMRPRVTGDESASPRGRIAAMRAVHAGDAPMDHVFTAGMEIGRASGRGRGEISGGAGFLKKKKTKVSRDKKQTR